MLSCGVFIDLKKAFDTIDHCILLQKLYQYGITGIINDWFHSYLTDRVQSTQIVSSKLPTLGRPLRVRARAFIIPLVRQRFM